jgi:hypothetical protein
VARMKQGIECDRALWMRHCITFREKLLKMLESWYQKSCMAHVGVFAHINNIWQACRADPL